MFGERYIVKKGDNLWRIAARELGGGGQWPRIWRYNNRRDIVRVTGRSIKNPDLIHVGQLLLIPKLPTATVAPNEADERIANQMPVAISSIAGPAKPPSQSAEHRAGTAPTLSDQAPKVRMPVAFKFRMDQSSPPQDVGTAIIEVKMTADVLLLSKRTYPATFFIQSGEIEHQMTNEANHALGKLISDNRYILDPNTRTMTFRSMLVSQSKTPNLPATALGVETSSNSLYPKLRAELRIPKLEGSINAFHYTALDTKVVLLVTPKPLTPRESQQPLRERAPAELRSDQQSIATASETTGLSGSRAVAWSLRQV